MMDDDQWNEIVHRDKKSVARLGNPYTDPLLRAEMDRRMLVQEVTHLRAIVASIPDIELHYSRTAPKRCRVVLGGEVLFDGEDSAGRLILNGSRRLEDGGPL